MSKLKRVKKRGRAEWIQLEGTHFLTVDLEIFFKNAAYGVGPRIR